MRRIFRSWRLVAVLAALALGMAGSALSASAAHASPASPAATIRLAAPLTMAELCDEINGGGWCLNAWNGGPLVKAYTAGVTNDWFYSMGSGSTVEIVDGNTGMYVGDYLDSSSDAKAGLLSAAGGWGSYFTAYSCGVSQGIAFHNNHWDAWLNGGDANGDQFYLNSNEKCYYGNTF